MTQCARPALLFALGGLLLFAAACGGGDDGFAERVEDPFAGGYPMYAGEDGLQVIVGTPDLGPGDRRVSLSLFTRSSFTRSSAIGGEMHLVSDPEVTARTYFYPDGRSGERDGPIQERTLRYGELPPGGRGMHRGALTFEQPGLYGIEVDVPAADDEGEVLTTLVPLEVADAPRAPDIGEPAPASEHPRLADVPGVEHLTTSWDPDPALYDTTIASAIGDGQPFVVVFTSPAFCTTALCGPQAELLSELADEHRGTAEFIHVDLYENPHEIQGDLERARYSPVLEQWGIVTDQWTFVVDDEGQIAARFEGFVPRDELEPALLAVTGEE